MRMYFFLYSIYTQIHQHIIFADCQACGDVEGLGETGVMGVTVTFVRRRCSTSAARSSSMCLISRAAGSPILLARHLYVCCDSLFFTDFSFSLTVPMLPIWIYRVVHVCVHVYIIIFYYRAGPDVSLAYLIIPHKTFFVNVNPWYIYTYDDCIKIYVNGMKNATWFNVSHWYIRT